MKRQASFYINLLFLLAVLMAAGIVLFAGVNFQVSNAAFLKERPEAFDKGWVSQKQELPGGAVHITMKNTLPENRWGDWALGFSANHFRYSAFVGDDLIFEYDMDNKTAFGTAFGDPLQIIPLPDAVDEKEVRLEIYLAHEKLARPISDMVIGSEMSIAVEQIAGDLDVLIFCTVIFALGVLFMGIALWFKWKVWQYNYKTFLYLGLFFLISGLWVLTDSRLLQMVIGNVSVIYLTSFFVFMFLPLPFLLYMREMSNSGQKTLAAFAVLFIAAFFINATLYITGLAELWQTIWIVHLLIFALIVYIFRLCIRERKIYENDELTGILLALSILLFTAVVSICLFYVDTIKDRSFVLRYGLILFAVVLCSGTLKKAIRAMHASTEMKMYREMAYKDSMTKLLNRAAFEEEIGEIKRQHKKYNSISIILMDLNHLKQINDTRGHMEGDGYICRFAEILLEVFAGVGNVFRIGGDEFAVIAYNKRPEDLDQQICIINRKNEVAFAWGIETVCPDGQWIDMDALFKRADAAMYERKKEQEMEKEIWTI